MKKIVFSAALVCLLPLLAFGITIPAGRGPVLETLPAGQSVTITAGANGTAIVYRMRGTTTLDTILLSAGQSHSYGPYNKDLQFSISALRDAVTFANQETVVDFSIAAGGSNSALVPINATYTASGCSNSTLIGGAIAGPGIAFGTLVAGASGTCTITVTLPLTQNKWGCWSTDVTSQIAFVQTAPLSATGCTLTGVAANGDAITILGLGN